jgi:NAD(P)-dependent dehydrogenase (short-subunit alcohol dehydrogenase family)
MVLTCWEKIAVVVVAAVGLRIAVRLSLVVWKKLIAPGLGLGIDVASQGKWAVVTGATDGLGKAFAHALANKGLDIVLVSRTLEKLESVAAEIKQKYGVETRIVEADLTEGQRVYSKIGKAIEELEVRGSPRFNPSVRAISLPQSPERRDSFGKSLHCLFIAVGTRQKPSYFLLLPERKRQIIALIRLQEVRHRIINFAVSLFDNCQSLVTARHPKVIKVT